MSHALTAIHPPELAKCDPDKSRRIPSPNDCHSATTLFATIRLEYMR